MDALSEMALKDKTLSACFKASRTRQLSQLPNAMAIRNRYPHSPEQPLFLGHPAVFSIFVKDSTTRQSKACADPFQSRF